MSQKDDFFKVRDIDTPIQPRKKKHQNNVSFRTTCGVSEIIAKIWIFALPLYVSAGIPAENAYREGKYPIFCDYLRDAASGPKTFLGPN